MASGRNTLALAAAEPIAPVPMAITLPEKDGANYIARYRLRWRDPTRGGDPNQPPPSIEFEIDATTGQIHMMNVRNPNTFRPDLKLNVHPPVVGRIGQGSQGTPIGPGRKITPVSLAYAQAFLTAILPQLSDYIKKTGFAVKTPVLVKDVNMIKYLAKYSCGIVEGDPTADIYLRCAIGAVRATTPVTMGEASQRIKADSGKLESLYYDDKAYWGSRPPIDVPISVQK